MKIRLKSGAEYVGTAHEIVEQMRQSDFDPPATVREYVARAVARASHYFESELHVNARAGTEQELAERFIAEAVAKGFAQEVEVS